MTQLARPEATTGERRSSHPSWCACADDGDRHESAPCGSAGGATLRLERADGLDGGITCIVLEGSGLRLGLDPAQATRLAADLREYAELAELGEHQWRRAVRRSSLPG